ncbi:HNH endonuclease [Croceicoccus marinus]|uniref:HNH endonuclease n=1 Tax=Croceicoccus marinus TaxID=450378 RepID=UPI000A90C4F4|nr:HNH endonuclease [Croceicoccus marinus]
MKNTDDRLRHPGLIWSSELRDAAYYHGYRGEGGEADGWLYFRNQEGVPGEIALAIGPADDGSPWFMAIDHPGVIAEFEAASAGPPPGRFRAAYAFATRAQLHDGINRVFHLARSVPDYPLTAFLEETAYLGDTEAERVLRQRKGQDRFRTALLDYWQSRCPLSGVAESRLLRASHIVPWALCDSDAKRLDVHNGLLLAAHLDAAFDSGLASFDDFGALLLKNELGPAEIGLLDVSGRRIANLTDAHRKNLSWHRRHFGF